MRFYNNVSDAMSGYIEELGDAIALALRTLLETKHLYQSVTVDEVTVSRSFWTRVESKIKSHLDQTGSLNYEAGAKPWILVNDHGLAAVGATRPNVFGIPFTPPHAKLYCKTCQRVEPFNLATAASTIDLAKYNLTVIAGRGTIEQVYSLSYLCQSCKKLPEVFLVRRTGGKLMLSGRSPMEHVSVPPEIPKEIASYYSGAVIARQSGQTLAALFMLRTACEQWARRFGEPTDYADDAINKYMDSLPPDFKSRFPSLRDIYSQISADIHAAQGSDELYAKMIADVDEHFQARRMFKELKTSK